MRGRGSNGRPLRFLALTLGGWTAARVVLLWPAAPVAMPVPMPMPGPTPVPMPVAQARSPAGASTPPGHGPGGRLAAAVERPASALLPMPARPSAVPPPERRGDRAALAAPVAPVPIDPPLAERGVIPLPLVPGNAPGRSRVAASAWAIVRGGGGGSAGALLAGQLGASQAGARLTYALGEGRRVALSARIATPLSGRGREAAVGLDWQPTRMPLHLLAEQRLPLDGQRGGPTLMLVGGIDPTPVVAGFRLEGYGQAGAIERASVEAFGDGAARLTRVVASVGPARLDLGGGAWGAAQRGVRRLDIGPTVGAAVPVAGAALRLTLDWRERLAGNARPGSGPALSIGTDF